MSQRRQRLTKMSPNEFQEKLTKKFDVVSNLHQVVATAVQDGSIEPYEYPEIEAWFGVSLASLFGVPSASSIGIDTLLTQKAIATAHAITDEAVQAGDRSRQLAGTPS